jgi:hypothetical protein
MLLWNQTLKVKHLRTNHSVDEPATENISWAKAADVYSTPQRFAENRPRYRAQEVTQLRIIFIYVIADRITILSKRFLTKIIPHFYPIYRKCSTYTTKGAPRQRLPIIRVRRILNNIAVFKTPASLPNIYNSHHNTTLLPNISKVLHIHHKKEPHDKDFPSFEWDGS